MKALKILIVLFGISIFGISCEEPDNMIYDVMDNVKLDGAILRTVEGPASLVFITNSNPEKKRIHILMEEQEGDGSQPAQFKEVRVYIRMYKDQDLVTPLSDANSNALPETLYKTISASEFGVSNIGLPIYELNIPTQDYLDTFPTGVYDLPSNKVYYVTTRLELELLDGRVFSNNNVASTIATGVYFKSPFFYKTPFKK